MKLPCHRRTGFRPERWRGHLADLDAARGCSQANRLSDAMREADFVAIACLEVADVIAHRPMPPEDAAALLTRNAEVLNHAADEAVREMLRDCIQSDEYSER